MKKIFVSFLSIVMLFTLSCSAFATELEPVKNEYGTYDLLDGRLRGISIPKSGWNLTSRDYSGSLSNVGAGVYTNYKFFPNTDGELWVGWDVMPVQSGTTVQLKITLYNAKTDKVVSTKYGDGMLYPNTDKGSAWFVDLDDNTEYYIKFSADPTNIQIGGTIYVSHSSQF